MSYPLRETLRSPSIYAPVTARITAIHHLTQMEKLFTIELPGGLYIDHQPGQFVEVSLLGVGEAPISIASSPSRSNGSFELCIRKAGQLTSLIHALETGDLLGIRGPFGNGFPIRSFQGKDLLFVIGGLGLAPARSLIYDVLDERSSFGQVTILYGARTPSELLFKEELDEWAASDEIDLQLTVDHPDGSWSGNIGVITSLIPAVQVYFHNTVAIVIGPPIMYRFALTELLGKGLRDGNIWLSLERRMKCGVGKCGHCMIDNLFCCQDGPCFSYAQIKNLQEAL
jgi:sulfhydrogenase subunit gamma (sulfur reductase)